MLMNSYDPDHAPDPSAWLALDEQQRILLVTEHHARLHIKLPSRKTHAIFHVIVENQLAENHPPVVRALARLTAQNLSRHDAVHAIASVVVAHIHELLNDEADAISSKATYFAAVERLTAKSWLNEPRV